MKRLTYKQRAILCVVGGFLLTTGGGFSASLSLFMIPVTGEYGFSQASFAAYMSLMSWFGILSHPIMGRIFAKYAKHIRLIAAIAAFYGFLCFFLLSRGRELYQFYIVGAMMSMLLPFAGSMLGVTVVSWWFTTGRSVAISCVAVGASVGTLFYAKMAGYVITKMGWRPAYVSLAILIFVVTILGAFCIAPPPEYLGMKPDETEAKTASPSAEELAKTVTLPELLHAAPFWLLCGVALFGLSYVMTIQQSIVPMLQIDFGQSPSSAATLLSVYSIVCACCKPLLGIVYKKFGQVVAICYTSALIILAGLLIFLSRNFTAAILAIVLFGVGNMLAMVLLPSLVSDVFGARNYPVVNGYVGIFFTIGAGIGPILTGRVFDLTGSYRIGFLLISILALIAATLMLLTVKSHKRTT